MGLDKKRSAEEGTGEDTPCLPPTPFTLFSAEFSKYNLQEQHREASPLSNSNGRFKEPSANQRLTLVVTEII